MRRLRHNGQVWLTPPLQDSVKAPFHIVLNLYGFLSILRRPSAWLIAVKRPNFMADGLSIAASAIQLADSGFKLYGALSQYIKDYVDANKHVRRLADEVRTTSWALQQLGAVLKEDDDIKLCKPEAISETEAALSGCQTAFDEVSDIIKEFIPTSISSLKDGIPGSKRWKWPLKKAKVQLLLAQLERLKTTLLLVFKVLSYASKLASK